MLVLDSQVFWFSFSSAGFVIRPFSKINELIIDLVTVIEPSLNTFRNWILWIHRYSPIRVVISSTKSENMNRTNRCPEAVYAVCSHSKNSVCHISVVFFDMRNLLICAVKERVIFDTVYIENIFYGPSVIQWLKHKKWNFQKWSKILGKHTVFWFIRIFLYALSSRIFYLCIYQTHKVFETVLVIMPSWCNIHRIQENSTIRKSPYFGNFGSFFNIVRPCESSQPSCWVSTDDNVSGFRKEFMRPFHIIKLGYSNIVTSKIKFSSFVWNWISPSSLMSGTIAVL